MRNRIKCAKCNDIIESTYRHDFQTCACGNVSCDGGHDYKRYVGSLGDIIIILDDGTEIPNSQVPFSPKKHSLSQKDAPGGERKKYSVPPKDHWLYKEVFSDIQEYLSECEALSEGTSIWGFIRHLRYKYTLLLED